MNIEDKWTIGIISTSFDLENERKILIDDLIKKGFAVVAFEEANFPMSMEKNKNDACLDAFDNIDVGIIIIGNELGHINENGVSISQMEYEHIVHFGKYHYVFVQSHTWYNYQKPDMKKLVKSASFLDFINDNNGFITPYNDVIQLKELINGRLVNFSTILAKTFAESQFHKLMNSKTIPVVGNSVSEQINNYFIKPQVVPEKDVLGKNIEISKLYQKLTHTKTTKHILIRGDIGSGKSTILYLNYINHYRAFKSGKETKIPLYLCLRGKKKDYTLKDYFTECFEQDLGMAPYPLFNLKRKSFVLYLDGLDEMHNIKEHEDISSFFESAFFKDLVMIACRTNFYEAYIQEECLSEKIDIDLTICKWTKTKIEEYIKKIFPKGEEKNRTYIYNWLHNNFNNWLQTPLMISVICFLLKGLSAHKGINSILNKIINERTLMIQYTNLFIKREIARTTTDSHYTERMTDTIYSMLKEMAWFLYQQKLSSNYKLLEQIDNRNTLEFKIAETYFEVTCFEGYYAYNVHEYFVDFMVSLYILDKMKCSDDNDFLNYMLSANINKLIFQGINKYNLAEKKLISDNLFCIYTKALTFEGKNIIKRTHIVYYLSRINLAENKTRLKSILHNQEKEVEIRLSICFGMVKLGDLEEEAFLYDKIENDIEWDETNRGYHLLYYKDVENKEVPFRDNGKTSWKKTFKALKNHICNEEQYYYLGRIDLQIMRKFLLTHDEDLFRAEDIEELEQNILAKWDKSDSFCREVINEWHLLKKSIKN